MNGSSSNKRSAEAIREGDTWMDVRILKETLDCTICFEHLTTEIYQCSVGHFVCSSCRDKILDKKCPTCSIKTSFNRCFGMEHVVQSVAFPCSNAKYGCREGHTYYQKERHEQVCTYAPCFCPAPDCSFAGPTSELLDHLSIYHVSPCTDLLDSGTVSLSLEPGIHVLSSRSKTTNYFFLLNMEPEHLGYAISVVCIQPKATEPKFTCNMNYYCSVTGYCQSSSCHIKSSTLSDGLPTDYDFILPKGKVSVGDQTVVMLRITIHEASSVGRSRVQGNGPTSAPLTPFRCCSDDDADILFTP
ncbi:E3 ubiquitin-protein ligase SINA-like 7 [Hordeum vulgare]|uniref:RING-type E3 ubiquitin transferase n=1 Tax=Hordeum vulgare subsp. vulgare TaxID=112509 RepID=A0A8I6X3D2_HORVV|nr:E3 ubiquitin-protein ligase SINA-like 7 [Hordeum vulgare subsp. vulgare]KAE8780897.1 E3 ubiquitin-protein ligase SINA-like 7 [Hordeum vulgare]